MDLIDRQAAIDAVRSYMADSEIEDSDWHADGIAYDIKRLPTAEPKTGRWTVIDEAEPRRYGCSNCKRLVWHVENFCPNCGAKMEGEKNE